MNNTSKNALVDNTAVYYTLYDRSRRWNAHNMYKEHLHLIFHTRTTTGYNDKICLIIYHNADVLVIEGNRITSVSETLKTDHS